MHPYRRRPSGEIDLGPSSARSETRLKVPTGERRVEGQYVSRYDRVRTLLRSYLSPILVDSVLERAMKTRNFSPWMLNDAALSEITADIMVGLRLFVPQAKLSQLMLELADILSAGDP